VEVVRRGDDDGIDFAGTDEFAAVRELFVAVAELVHLARVDVAHRDNVAALHGPRLEMPDMVGAHDADAYDSDANFL